MTSLPNLIQIMETDGWHASGCCPPANAYSDAKSRYHVRSSLRSLAAVDRSAPSAAVLDRRSQRAGVDALVVDAFERVVRRDAP